MKIEIDDESYVNVYDDCADAESWQQVGYVISRAAIETLSALGRAGIDFDDVLVFDDDMQFMFMVHVNPKYADQALKILRDQLQEALQRWNECSDPDYWLPDSTGTS